MLRALMKLTFTKIPQTPEEFLKLRDKLLWFGVEDSDQTWAAVYNLLQNAPKTTLYVQWKRIVNPVLRLKIDGALQDAKLVVYRRLEEALKKKLEEEKAKDGAALPQRALDLSDEVPSL